MISEIISFFLERRLISMICLFLIVIIGTYSFLNLNMDAFPDVTNIQVEIIVTAKHLSPFEIERVVNFPIENSLRGIPGLSSIRSITKFGISVITVIFEENVDIFFARQQIFERISAFSGKLPEDIEIEIAPLTTAMGEIYQYTLEGGENLYEDEVKRLTELRTIQDYIVAPILKSVKGVSDINSFGGYIEQINIEVDPLKLYKYNIAVNDLFESIEKNNLNVGGSIISKNSEQFIVQGIGIFNSIRDIDNILVKSINGFPIYIKDVGIVKNSHSLRRGASIKDGKEEVVGGIVMMLRGENSREVVRRVEEKVDEINRGGFLPAGMKIKPYYDRSEIIKKSIDVVLKAIAEGAILVIFVIFLFVRQLRGALIVVLSLPLSALLTFIIMRLLDINANLMSLGGLAISIGMIVDASIIQVENVQRNLNEEKSANKFSTVLKAVLEVRKPSIFGELIIASVFLPILSLQGMEGKMFSPLAKTFIIALFSSLALSIILTPSLCFIFLRKSSKSETFFSKLVGKIYSKLIIFSLNRKFLVISFSFVILAISLFLYPRIGREFIPVLDEGAFDMDFQCLPGVSLEKSIEISKLVGLKLMEFPELETVISKTGQTGIALEARSEDRTGFVGILKPKSQWRSAKTRDELFEKMRESVAEIPGIVFSFSQPIQCRISELMEGTRAQLIVKIFGDDLNILQNKAKEIEGILSKIRGAEDIMIDSIFLQPYLILRVDREKIARYGLDIKDVLNTFELAMGEKVATKFYVGSRYINVALRFPEEFKKSFQSIGELIIRTPENFSIALKEIAQLQEIEGPSQILRENGKRRIGIELNVSNRDIVSFVEEAKKIVRERVSLPLGYYIEWGGQFQEQQRTMNRLKIIVPIVLILIFLMLSLSFNSFKRAILAIIGLPFSLVGGIFVVYFAGFYLSVPASIGFIATFGISVLNGVVLISHIQKLEEEGSPLREAILKGSKTRLRPVLMTALTTAFGLIPMLLATGPGSEIQKPLAVVVFGGLITSTFLTLIVLPSFYELFFKKS